MQENKKNNADTAKILSEPRFLIELPIETKRPFYNILLEAIDEAFMSLGESAKVSIYFYLEKTKGIKRQEIPFRIDDFQNALEQLLGMGARHLEILFIKKLHEKLETCYKWNMPQWVVPELTFKEYLHLLMEDFEKANPPENSEEAGCTV